MPDGTIEALAIPGVVCYAFSIELGLKALLLESGSPPHTHNLRDLFNALPDERRDEIQTALARSAAEFDESITAVADAFNEWRYLFERQSLAVHLAFLRELSVAVIQRFPQ